MSSLLYRQLFNWLPEQLFFFFDIHPFNKLEPESCEEARKALKVHVCVCIKSFQPGRYVLQVTTEWVLKSASQQMYRRLIYDSLSESITTVLWERCGFITTKRNIDIPW